MFKTIRRRMFGDAPTRPLASAEEYRKIWGRARAANYPAIDDFERQTGFGISLEWLHDLALHTQVVIKASDINYQHGRVLYAALRRYIADHGKSESVVVLETGTARGYSSVCMARALIDSEAIGQVITIDTLPHKKPMFWNCIDDHDGRKTRAELLQPWRRETERVTFLTGRVEPSLHRLGLTRIRFAFLDASHEYRDVIKEFRYVAAHQSVGDVVVLDDLTPAMFDGVVRAVSTIELEGEYEVRRLSASSARGYAIAIRTMT